MTRASKNLCFLISVTVVNVLIYMAMSGNFLIFKRTNEQEPRMSNIRRLAGDGVQDRISQLVKEAVREHGVSGKNLTEMLERAISEHGSTQGNSLGDTFIHQGKSDPINRTSGLDLLPKPDINPEEIGVRSSKRTESLSAGENTLNQKLPDGVEVELVKKQEVIVPKVPVPNSSGGVLGRLGNLLTGSKDTSKPVVFPHDFNLVLNEPNKCKNDDGGDKPVFFLVLVMSIHKNFDQRNAIRRTWGSPTEIDGKQVVTLFMLAKNTNPSHQRLIEQESRQYHDLLMEDFTDTYKNLTLKTIMGMKWASMYCAHANFVMKTDDDMYVNYANIVKYLMKPIVPKASFVTGFVINGGPIRDPKSKWYMPRETYPGNKYPPFCSGTGYMMSGDMPLRIYETSLNTPFLYLEDVYVAVCLSKMHVVPVNHKSFNNWRTPYSYCKYKNIFTTHMVTPTEMNRIWSDQKTVKAYRCFI